MNYSALIQNRKSVREFTEKAISTSEFFAIEAYYQVTAKRLLPELETKLMVFGGGTKQALENAAGYETFMIGAQQYLVLLSAKHELAGVNAGYIMEDLILKLTDMGLDSCWLTFTDSEAVKLALGITSELDVAAIVAFGYGVKTTKRLRLNKQSMSNVDISAQRQYFSPKHGILDMVFKGSWGSTQGVEEFIGFYDDMLWEAFYAASLAPSYLNRQPYGFVIHDGGITLVSTPDAYTHEADGQLGLGIVLLHFSAVAAQWAGKVSWSFEAPAGLALPEGYRAVATTAL